jgi:hypothetical protein
MPESNDAVLKRVPPEWHAEFCRFLETGEAGPEFLAYLDEHQECQEAVDKAMADQAGALAALGSQLGQVFERQAAPSRPAPRQATAPAAHGSRIFSVVAGLAAAGLAVLCVYLWGAERAAVEREAALRLNFRSSVQTARVADARDVLRDLPDLLKDSNPEVAMASAELLAASPGAVEKGLLALDERVRKETDPDRRQALARVQRQLFPVALVLAPTAAPPVGRVPEPLQKAVEERIRLAKNDLMSQDARTRLEAIRMLGEAASAAKDAVPLLVEVFKQAKDRGLKAEVVKAVWRIDPEAAKKNGDFTFTLDKGTALLDEGTASATKLRYVPYLEKPGEERLIAAFHLGALGPKGAGAVPALVSAYKSEDDPVVLRALADALWAIDPEQAKELKLYDPAAGKATLACMKQANKRTVDTALFELKQEVGDPELRVMAAEALSEVGPAAKESYPFVFERYRGENHSDVRQALRNALGAIDPERAAKDGMRQ